METLLQHLRYALRTLRKSPGFTAVAVLTLALGIGANTAIFSVVRSVLLRPLAYEAPDHLVRVYELFPIGGGQSGRGSVSVPNFRDWREQISAFEQLAAFSWGSLNLQGVERPERLVSASVTSNLFSLLGARPVAGRTFVEGEDERGAPKVVMLSESLWDRRFGSDPAIVGRSIVLDGEAYTVVGVMPAGFRFPARGTPSDVWVPLQFSEGQEQSRGSHWMGVIGRLRPGVTVASAQAELERVAARLAQLYPDAQAGRSALAVPLEEDVVGNIRPALLVLLGASALVLLIACANAANLLLARAAARRREVAIRSAIGAGRSQLVRQFLTESVVLALAGAALGLVLAYWGVEALVALAGRQLPRAGEIRFDGLVFLFLLIVATVTGIAFGLVPALQASGSGLHGHLREGGRQGTGRAGRVRAGLVVGQVALSLVLLIGAGLLVKTLAALLGTETGMKTENVLTMRVAVPDGRYAGRRVVPEFYRPVAERVRALPGVRAAGWISHLPLAQWGFNGRVGIVGRPPADDPGEQPRAEFRAVSLGYFEALGIPVERGRDLSPQDFDGSAPVVLINHTFAERYFPGEDPIGRRLILLDTVAIAGVVGDVRQSGLKQDPRAEIYYPYAYRSPTEMTLVVSTAVPPEALANAIQDEIHAIDPEQPVYGVRTMERVVIESVASSRLYMWLLGGFATVALALAVAGIYGVVSYGVGQRTREFGIRMALGARADAVRRLVLRQGVMLAAVGLALGLPAAFWLTRLLAGLLYGVSPVDPVIFVGVAVLLAAVAVGASWIPARRATRVDPMVALRAE